MKKQKRNISKEKAYIHIVSNYVPEWVRELSELQKDISLFLKSPTLKNKKKIEDKGVKFFHPF